MQVNKSFAVPGALRSAPCPLFHCRASGRRHPHSTTRAAVPDSDLSADYSETMSKAMNATLTYDHSLGMNYTRILDDLIVGSCLQKPTDVEQLEREGVTTVLQLQEDSDLEYFSLDNAPIRDRCAAGPTYMTFCSQSCAANEAGKHRVEERPAEEKPSCSTTTRPLWDRSATESVTETPPRPADRLDMANILSTRRCRLSRPPQIYISLHSYTYPFFPSILLFIHPHLRNDVQVLRSRAGAHLECPFGFRWRGHGLWRCEPGAYHLYDLLDDPSLYYLVVAGAQRRIGRVDARTCDLSDLSDLSDQTRSLGQTSSHSFVSFFQVNRTGRNACGFNPKSLGKRW